MRQLSNAAASKEIESTAQNLAMDRIFFSEMPLEHLEVIAEVLTDIVKSSSHEDIVDRAHFTAGVFTAVLRQRHYAEKGNDALSSLLTDPGDDGTDPKDEGHSESPQDPR